LKRDFANFKTGMKKISVDDIFMRYFSPVLFEVVCVCMEGGRGRGAY